MGDPYKEAEQWGPTDGVEGLDKPSDPRFEWKGMYTPIPGRAWAVTKVILIIAAIIAAIWFTSSSS